MISKNIIKKMKSDDYLVIKHANKSIRKNIVLQANNLVNYFLQKNIDNRKRRYKAPGLKLLLFDIIKYRFSYKFVTSFIIMHMAIRIK